MLANSTLQLLDWGVVAAYLVFTTWIGARFAGEQATIRDFFLGGRRLSWWAVCGSIIATELSAVSFVVVPAILFAPGGDLKYLQLAIGTIAARFVIARFFVPRYYEHEIYSPYEFLGERLGPRVHHVTSALFVVGAVLAQGVRVYVTALVLQVVADVPLVASIWIIGAFAVLWTLLGGITTVIWTDVVQFFLLFGGALVIFGVVAFQIGIGPIFESAAAAGKFELWSLSLDPKQAYTLWTALLGATFLTLASHGTDQMMAQRIFCCRDQRDAQKAIVWSSSSQVLTVLLMLVGAALFAWYERFPLGPDQAAEVAAKSSRILPIFIVQAVPVGLAGLIVSGLFAAAISSLDSVLSALAQNTVNTVYRPHVAPQASEAHYLRASRIFVVLWGIALCGMAIACIPLEGTQQNLVDLALAMTTYTYGALLGTFLLALLPVHADDRGVSYAAPLTMISIFATSWHGPVPALVVLAASTLLLGFAGRSFRGEAPRQALVFGVVLAALLVSGWGGSEALDLVYAWPWNFPLGTALAFGLGWALSRPHPRAASAAARTVAAPQAG